LIFVIDFVWRKQNFRFSYAFVRFILLFNWGLTLIFLLIGQSKIEFLDRATGSYWWAYLVMLTSAIILPALLLHKKWGRNKWILLLVGMLSTFGQSLEIFVILITSFHQDSLTNSSTVNYLAVLIIRPFIIVCFLIGIDLIFLRKKIKTIQKNNTDEEVLDSN
jgi:hypothetical protein